MVRDIAIMIAAIAAIVAFAPKVSGRADHPVDRGGRHGLPEAARRDAGMFDTPR